MIPRTQVEERTKKEKARKELILNLDFSASETPNEEGYGHAWESDDWSSSHWSDESWTSAAGWFRTEAHTAWMVTTPLNLANHPTHVVLDLGCILSIGSRVAIERFKKHRNFAVEKKSVVFTNSETETCMESCIVHFPTAPPCSTKVDVLETGDVPILLSLPQMKNLGMTTELDPKGDEITRPAFGRNSSSAEYSTMGHIVLDLTNLTYQPTTKSRERPGHPRRHVTFAMSERKPAHPAHAPDMHEDEDEDDPTTCAASIKERTC